MLTPVGLWFQEHTSVGGPSVPLRDVRCPAPCEGLPPPLTEMPPTNNEGMLAERPDTRVHCGTITTATLSNASVVSRGGLGGAARVPGTLIYVLSEFRVHSRVINSGHLAVHRIPRTRPSCHCTFAPFDPQLPVSPAPHPAPRFSLLPQVRLF